MPIGFLVIGTAPTHGPPLCGQVLRDRPTFKLAISNQDRKRALTSQNLSRKKHLALVDDIDSLSMARKGKIVF
jgi:hypothetical protein